MQSGCNGCTGDQCPATESLHDPQTFSCSPAALLLSALGGIAIAASANAQNLPWFARLRAVDLVSSNKDSTGLDLSINDKVIPEIDFSYFLTPQWAVELVVTCPQKQTLRAGGSEIGSLKHLPPTLTAHHSPRSVPS